MVNIKDFIKFVAQQDQIQHVHRVLEEGGVAKRGSFDGDYFQQLFGLIAQTYIADRFGVERPKVEDGFDEGYDMILGSKKYDVKCLILNGPYKHGYAHNLNGAQKGYDCDGYIFIAYDRKSGLYTICGYIQKDEFMKHAEFFQEGAKRPRKDGSYMVVKSGGLYEIKCKHLRPINELNGGQIPVQAPTLR